MTTLSLNQFLLIMKKTVALSLFVGFIALSSCQKEALNKETEHLAETPEELLYSADPNLWEEVYQNEEKRLDEPYVNFVPGYFKLSCMEADVVQPMCCLDGSLCYIIVESAKGTNDEPINTEGTDKLVPNTASPQVIMGTLESDAVIDPAGEMLSGTFTLNSAP